MLSSEDDVLAIVARHFPNTHSSLLLGRGDDCAVLRPLGPLAISTDVFAEDTHFRRGYFTAYDIGFKALAVNLSDIASSGARPLGFSMGLSLTGREDESWIDSFCEGMAALADTFDICAAGGDISLSPQMNICITAWGELPKDLPMGLRRGMAQEGDLIVLLGEVGLARLGLTVLEKALLSAQNEGAHIFSKARESWPEACSRHLRPLPLAREGVLLGRFALEHGAGNRMGLMDISDGLARDLPRLLASHATGLGSSLVLPEHALHPEVRQYAELHGLDAALFALEGGEDYALACTCPKYLWPELENLLNTLHVRALLLGEAKKGAFTLNGNPITAKGFDHFGA